MRPLVLETTSWGRPVNSLLWLMGVVFCPLNVNYFNCVFLYFSFYDIIHPTSQVSHHCSWFFFAYMVKLCITLKAWVWHCEAGLSAQYQLIIQKIMYCWKIEKTGGWPCRAWRECARFMQCPDQTIAHETSEFFITCII